MKHFILCIMMLLSTSLYAQQFEAPRKNSTPVDTTTTYTYKIDTNIYKVYKSKNGAFYIWKVSKKTNKPYKMYLPKEVQVKMGRKYED